MADQPVSRSDGSGARRRRISLVSPAGTSSWYQSAALVPVASGLTVARPCTTWSLIPSLGYGSPGWLQSLSVLLSLWQNTASGAPSPRSAIGPSSGSRASSAPSVSVIAGRSDSGSHDQRLRNHRWGSTCSVAASGPALRTVTRMQMSAGLGLRVVDRDVPVAVLVEQARVEQLVLALVTAAGAVDLEQLLVGELALRVHVAPPHPRVRGRRVEVPPVLLGVLAVVALVPGQAEDALLQDRVAPVPEGERHAQQLLVVADAARGRPRSSGRSRDRA